MTHAHASAAALRARHRLGTLDPVYAAVLDSVDPGWSDSQATRSRSADIRALTVFIGRERHSDVPAAHVEEGRAVGAFAKRSRVAYAEGILEPAAETALQKLAGWEWRAADARWYRALGHLRAWTRANPGTSLRAGVIHGDFPLGAWWSKTGAAILSGRLDPRRTREAAAAWAGDQ